MGIGLIELRFQINVVIVVWIILNHRVTSSAFREQTKSRVNYVMIKGPVPIKNTPKNFFKFVQLSSLLLNNNRVYFRYALFFIKVRMLYCSRGINTYNWSNTRLKLAIKVINGVSDRFFAIRSVPSHERQCCVL